MQLLLSDLILLTTQKVTDSERGVPTD